MHYFDYTANTPVSPEVLKVFCQTEEAFIGNPNSDHAFGKAANNRLSAVSKEISGILELDDEEIIYTSGASESNNLAIKGIAHTTRHKGKHIISTALEHPSVSAPLSYLQEKGYEIDLVNILGNGKIDLTHLGELLRKDTVLVAVSAVDSELGTIQPVSRIAQMLKDYPECKLHVDATGAIGKMKLNFSEFDTCSLSAHKIYGLNGSGLLIKKKGLVLEPIIHGGNSSSLYRSGTPTLALAAAFEKALRLATDGAQENAARVKEINDIFRAFFAQFSCVRINSPSDCIPNILNISVAGVKGKAFQEALDRNGVCVSVKSACSVPDTPSRAVFAVSRDRKNALSSFRISFSHLTSDDDIKAFQLAFKNCLEEFGK